MEEIEDEEELQNLIGDPFKIDGHNGIMIQSFQHSNNISPLNTIRSDSSNLQSFRLLTKRKLSQPRNAANMTGNICSIPSIPTSKRKYGYFEAVNGILYPLVDAYQFLREGSVKRISVIIWDTNYVKNVPCLVVN